MDDLPDFSKWDRAMLDEWARNAYTMLQNQSEIVRFYQLAVKDLTAVLDKQAADSL